MWRATGAHVIGTSHVASNTPCQDYSGIERVVIGSTPAVLIALADGAGSAALSNIGARSTVEFLLAAIPVQLQNVLEANEQFAKQLFTGARNHLEALALEYGCNPHDMACTSLFAVLSDFSSFFAQIGDGAWVIRKDGEYCVPMWPDNGEYVNETTFLTSVNWEDSFQHYFTCGGVTAVAGLTDGLERVALLMSTRSAFGKFFDPLFSALRSAHDETTLISPLIQLLASERLAERTDDDKTLMLACYDAPLMLTDGC